MVSEKPEVAGQLPKSHLDTDNSLAGEDSDGQIQIPASAKIEKKGRENMLDNMLYRAENIPDKVFGSTTK